MIDLGDAKTFQNYAPCNEFKTFVFSENVEKSMPKGTPKVIVCVGRDRRTQGKSANPDRKDGVLESAGNDEPVP